MRTTAGEVPAIRIRSLFNSGIPDKEFMDIDQTPASPYANRIYVSNTMFDPSSNSEIAFG